MIPRHFGMRWAIPPRDSIHESSSRTVGLDRAPHRRYTVAAK
ncbi:hypothetical protein [Azospirillum doebereinerae]